MNQVLTAISSWFMKIFIELDSISLSGNISLLDMFVWMITLKMIFTFVSMFLLPTTGEIKESGKSIFSSLSRNAKNANSAQNLGVKQLHNNRKLGNK